MPKKMDGDIWTEMDKLGIDPFAFDEDTMDYSAPVIGRNIHNLPKKSKLEESKKDIVNQPKKWTLNL